MSLSNNSAYQTAKRQANNARKEMRNSVSKLVSDVSDTPKVVQTQIKNNLKDLAHELSPAERIRRNPKTAVAGALVAGAVVGCLIPSARAVKPAEISGAYKRARALINQASEKLNGLATRSGIPQAKINDGRQMVMSLAAQLLTGMVTKLVAEHVERRDRNTTGASARATEARQHYRG